MYPGRIANAVTTFCSLLSLATLCASAPAGNDLSIRDTALDNNPDCIWSAKYAPKTYLDCYSNWPGGSQLEYTIRLTGTGMKSNQWTNSIIGSIGRACNFPQIFPVKNDDNSIYARSTVLDGDRDHWPQVTLQGVDMTFIIICRWFTDDDNHKCIAQAVRDATCSQIEIANGAHCVSLGYSSNGVTEYWDKPGPNHF